MRILHLLIFPYFGSGSGTYCRKLAEKTAKLGHEVAVVAPDEPDRIEKVKTYTVKMPFRVAFTGHPDWPNCKKYAELTNQEVNKIIDCFQKRMLEAIEDFKPDVLHIHHESYTAWIAKYIKSIYRIPYLVTAHGTGTLNATLDYRWHPLGSVGLMSADYIICVSNDTKKWLLKVYGKNLTKKTRILPGGVDLEKFSHNSHVGIIDKKYNLKGKKVVIFVGKLTKPKGVEYLVKAAKKIKGEIFILGGGDEKENLTKLAKNLKLKNVHFLGYFGKEYVEELREFYRRADVVVVPSIWDEPLGLVVLEAMAAFTPVVASKKGGIPLAVKDGYNGFLARAKSSKEIAQAVNRILADENLAEQLGKNARETVEKKFSWKILAQKIIEWYGVAISQAQKKKKTGKLLPYIDITKEKVEIKGKKLDYI